MMAILTPLKCSIAERREDRLAGVLVGDVGGQELEVRAGEPVAVLAAVDRVAAAVLHAQQLVDALVELVVADPVVVQAHQVEGLDGRLVVEDRGDERRGADQVAGRHEERVGIRGPRACRRAWRGTRRRRRGCWPIRPDELTGSMGSRLPWKSFNPSSWMSVVWARSAARSLAALAEDAAQAGTIGRQQCDGSNGGYGSLHLGPFTVSGAPVRRPTDRIGPCQTPTVRSRHSAHLAPLRPGARRRSRRCEVIRAICDDRRSAADGLPSGRPLRPGRRAASRGPRGAAVRSRRRRRSSPRAAGRAGRSRSRRPGCRARRPPGTARGAGSRPG